MRIGWGVLALLAAAAPSFSYFKYERPLQTATSGGQYYAVVDETVWSHARADLADLRLYSEQREIPFALTVETGGSETEQRMLHILQPGTLGGKTQFLLDMSGAAEYDSVLLTLATRNFVAHSRVEGQDDPHGKEWTTLGTTTLFDLTDERLGHNSTLHIPSSAYKYLRVTLDGVVKPADVQSASSDTTRTEKAVWRDVRTQVLREQSGRDTVFTFSLPENVPMERVSFAIDPTQPSFRRVVEIQGENNQPVGKGEITCVHMQRNGQRIDVEERALNVSLARPGKYRVIVRNGDDLPLKIAGAQPQQYERRIYFDVDADTQIQLLYGDEKLGPPTYDYRKLFQKEAIPGPLELGSETLNAAFTGRPDERPWSERYPALLWAAILGAVLLLGAIAVRSIKSANA
jgi:hypothetical protein